MAHLPEQPFRPGDKISASRLNAALNNRLVSLDIVVGESAKQRATVVGLQPYADPVMWVVTSTPTFDTTQRVWTAHGKRVYAWPCTIDGNGVVTGLSNTNDPAAVTRYITFGAEQETTLYFPVAASGSSYPQARCPAPSQLLNIVWACERNGRWEVITTPPMNAFVQFTDNLAGGGPASAIVMEWLAGGWASTGESIQVYDLPARHRVAAGDYAWCYYDYDFGRWVLLSAAPMWQILLAQADSAPSGGTVALKNVSALQPIGGTINALPTSAAYNLSTTIVANDWLVVFWNDPLARWEAVPVAKETTPVKYGRVYVDVDSSAASAVEVHIESCDSTGGNLVVGSFSAYTLPANDASWKVYCKTGTVVAYVTVPSEGNRNVIIGGPIYYKDVQIKYGRVYVDVNSSAENAVEVPIESCDSTGGNVVVGAFSAYTLPANDASWKVYCKTGTVVAYVTVPSEANRNVIISGAIYYRDGGQPRLFVRAQGKPVGGNGAGSRSVSVKACNYDGSGETGPAFYAVTLPAANGRETAIFEGRVLEAIQVGTTTIIVGGDWLDDPIGTIRMINNAINVPQGWQVIADVTDRYLRVGNVARNVGGAGVITPAHNAGMYAPPSHTIALQNHQGFTLRLQPDENAPQYEYILNASGSSSHSFDSYNTDLSHPVIDYQAITHHEIPNEPLYVTVVLIQRVE